MTLKEFVKAFMDANNDNRDVDEMCKHITAEARKVAKNGCAVLDEEQVEQIILGAKLEAPKNNERKEDMNLTSNGPKVVPLKEKKKPKPQKDDGQLDIFSLGVGLFD